MIWRRIDFNHMEIVHETNGAISYMAAGVHKACGELMEAEEGLHCIERIQSTLSRATKLARMFMQQPTRYLFEVPKGLLTQPTCFNSDTMCDLHGRERPEWNGESVQLAISPTITKVGDENGENVSDVAYRTSGPAGLC